MVLRAGLEPARISPHAPQTCAATNYATSANFQKSYLFPAGALALVSVFAGSELVFAAGSVEFEFTSGVFAGASVETFEAGASAGASGLLDSTETLPVSAGIESISASSMNNVAVIIVVFDNTVAVPLDPYALLDTLLVKSAPASVLPGCSNTVTTRTMHERKNKP